MSLRVLTRLSLLAAVAFALMFLGEVPVPWIPGAKLDLSEIPAVLAAVGMGPLAGLTVEVIKDFLFFLSGKSEAGWIGVAANLMAGGTLVLVIGWVSQALGVSRQARSLSPVQFWSRASAATVVAAVAMAGVMLVANALVFLPLWLPQNNLHWAMSLTWVPFNLIKGGFAGVCGLALHRRLAPVMAPDSPPAVRRAV